MSGFWLQYLFALFVVALMLAGLYAIARGVSRGRVLLSSDRRLLTVIESTALSQHTSLHVVKVGSKYLVIGGSNNGGLTPLAEMPQDEVEAWMAMQRTMVKAQRAQLQDVLKWFQRR